MLRLIWVYNFWNHLVLMRWVYQSLMSRFNVQGFPTILVFGADKDSPTPYEGARTASAIESFSLEQLETNVAPPEVTELTGPVSSKLLNESSAQKRYFRDLKRLQSFCVGCHGRKMWFGCHLFRGFPSRHFGFQSRRKEQVPSAATVSCRKVQEESLQAREHSIFMSPFPILGSFGFLFLESLLMSYQNPCIYHCIKHKGKSLAWPTLQKTIAEKSDSHFCCSYVWAAAGKQPDFEQHVGVGGYGYPALVALNVKKSVYAPLKSAFELEHIM